MNVDVLGQLEHELANARAEVAPTGKVGPLPDIDTLIGRLAATIKETT